MKYLFWLLLVLLILVRYFVTHPVYKSGDIVRITTTIYSDPVDYPNTQYIKIAGLKTYLSKFPEISYGDKIIIEGEVKGDSLGKPYKLDNPKLINREQFRGSTSKFRNSLVKFYQSVLPEPDAGLLSGIVLGAKGALQSDFYNQTKFVGVAHIVVASGTNVTFVVSFLMGVLTLFIPRKKAIPFVILGIVLYLFISGFDAPLVRAAIMSTFLFTAQETGRVVKTWRIFFLTILVMLVYNPNWLTDIGFILSFVSTACLLLFERKISLKLHKIPKFFREGLSTSFAAQIGVTPILFVTFGQFNLLSPFINMLVLPTVAPLMILGTIGGVVGLIFPFIGKILLWLSYPMLWWFVMVVEIFS